MASTVVTTGPWELVERLRSWAEATSWCEWLELAGSLARGAGDELSDVDAGLGVLIEGGSYAERRDAALEAARGFATVADTLVQHLGTAEKPADHLVVQYSDGRQLSVVVMPAGERPGLPPGSRALLDRTGRLATPFVPSSATADDEQQREWAYLAWWALSDVAKHAGRGAVWRAVESLHEARTHAWRLHAARLELDYPGFGVVSVENVDGERPVAMDRTLPASADPADLLAAARVLADVLDELAAGRSGALGVDGVRTEALRRLNAAHSTP